MAEPRERSVIPDAPTPTPEALERARVACPMDAIDASWHAARKLTRCGACQDIALALDAFAAERVEAALSARDSLRAMGCCTDAPHKHPYGWERRPHNYYGPRDGSHCWNRDELGMCGRPDVEHVAAIAARRGK